MEYLILYNKQLIITDEYIKMEFKKMITMKHRKYDCNQIFTTESNFYFK